VVGAVRPAASPLRLPEVPTFTTAPDTWSSTVSFFVNGVQQSVDNPDPSLHLIDYLRDTLMLKAPKVGNERWGLDLRVCCCCCCCCRCCCCCCCRACSACGAIMGIAREWCAESCGVLNTAL
jgi:hypothetical protein